MLSDELKRQIQEQKLSIAGVEGAAPTEQPKAEENKPEPAVQEQPQQPQQAQQATSSKRRNKKQRNKQQQTTQQDQQPSQPAQQDAQFPRQRAPLKPTSPPFTPGQTLSVQQPAAQQQSTLVRSQSQPAAQQQVNNLLVPGLSAFVGTASLPPEAIILKLGIVG